MSCDVREWVEVESNSSPITLGSRGQSFTYVEAPGPVFLQAASCKPSSPFSLSMRRSHVWKPTNNETHKRDIANKRAGSPPMSQPLPMPYGEIPINAVFNDKAWKNPV